MPYSWCLLGLVVMMLFSSCMAGKINGSPASSTIAPDSIILPAPRLSGSLSIEEGLNTRRSVREFTDESLSLSEVSQLLWAAQGVTSLEGARTVPSAGGLYPLEVYLISGMVMGLPAGIYRYDTNGHALFPIGAGDRRRDLSAASFSQKSVEDGAINLIISAVYSRTTQKYGVRGTRYVDMEAGHAAQNIALQSLALGLGAVTIGAFDDGSVKKLLALSEDETPLYVIPVGHPPKK
jgi:SagB-type dehydrogenase family enzyme